MVFNFNFLDSDPEEQDNNSNALMDYLQRQHPEILEKVAQSASTEIKEIISQNVQGLVGILPGEDFKVQITTDRDHLANLLASAMMTGYFLGQMEQRHKLDVNLEKTDSIKS